MFSRKPSSKNTENPSSDNIPTGGDIYYIDLDNNDVTMPPHLSLKDLLVKYCKTGMVVTFVL